MDEESGKPVAQFSYDYYIASPDRHEFPSHKEKVETRTEDGIIRIPAPRRCRLSVSAAAPGHIRCGGEFIVLPDDLKRTFAVELSPGENPSAQNAAGRDSQRAKREANCRGADIAGDHRVSNAGRVSRTR